MTPEARARQTIDALLTAAGWHVCNVANANLHAGSGAVKGIAIREFPLNPGHGFADYLLYVNGKACGVIQAKKEGAILSGVEVQSARYAQGLPAALPAWRWPLPVVFESTGVETRFANGLEPAPRARTNAEANTGMERFFAMACRVLCIELTCNKRTDEHEVSTGRN